MADTIELYVESVDDISPIDSKTLVVEMSGVDLGQLITEIGVENLLDEMAQEDIKNYIKEKEQDGE